MLIINTLHILNKPPEHSRTRLCLSVIGPGDALLLTENAVLAVTQPLTLSCNPWFVLGPDLEARGLAGQLGGGQQVSFDEMVGLTAAAANVVSW